VLLLTYLLLPQTELVLSGDIDALANSSKAILIANHQIYADCMMNLVRVLSVDSGL
jgi:1-acyl-sn-glycerol-3-phosphate acyltransferase